jgi:hypothetical protein
MLASNDAPTMAALLFECFVAATESKTLTKFHDDVEMSEILLEKRGTGSRTAGRSILPAKSSFNQFPKAEYTNWSAGTSFITSPPQVLILLIDFELGSSSEEGGRGNRLRSRLPVALEDFTGVAFYP